MGQRILQRFTTTHNYPRSRIVLEPNADSFKPFAPRTTFGLSLISDGPNYTTFTVTAVLRDSPAASIGFKVGDVLATIDDKPAASWTLGQVRTALAADGTNHTVDVVHVGQDKTQLEFTVTLDSIED